MTVFQAFSALFNSVNNYRCSGHCSPWNSAALEGRAFKTHKIYTNSHAF
uniref:Uncharacterized protein n=1 Tax=Anguilla anguilla TaxID=7936 RepID=A0A0E9WV90_ANGAN